MTDDDQVVLGLPSRRVWELARMPPSTLDYWVRTGLVRPTIRGSQGRRIERWWSLQDVLVVRAIRALRQAGASLQVVRAARKEIERCGQNFTEVRLHWDGTDLLITDTDGTRSARAHPGQGVLLFMTLPLGDWHQEHATDAALEEKNLRDIARENRAYRRAARERVLRTQRLLREA